MEDFIFNNIGKVIVILLVFIIIATPIIEVSACDVKAKGLGFNSEWSFFVGCRIEYEEGKWVPLNTYRVFEGD